MIKVKGQGQMYSDKRYFESTYCKFESFGIHTQGTQECYHFHPGVKTSNQSQVHMAQTFPILL